MKPEETVRVHDGEKLPRCPEPTHPNNITYPFGMCIYCHDELTVENEDVTCFTCATAIHHGELLPDHRTQILLRQILLQERWDNQGGYVGYSGYGHWDFISASLTVTPEIMNELFDLAGISPQQIVSAGDCKQCKWSCNHSRERGYVQPCLSCHRPRMSNFEAK